MIVCVLEIPAGMKLMLPPHCAKYLPEMRLVEASPAYKTGELIPSTEHFTASPSRLRVTFVDFDEIRPSPAYHELRTHYAMASQKEKADERLLP